MSQFIQTAEGKGINLLPNSGGNLISTWLQGEASTQLTPAQYQKYVSDYYKTTRPS